MEMIKKIVLRILLLVVIILISNFIYIHTTYKKDLRAEGNVLLKFQRGVESADALYFSASPNAATHQNDADQRTITQITDDLSPALKIEAVDTGGIHAGVFKQLIQLIPENSPVKTVIVEMNYRSFGMGWIQSKLENAIQKQMVFYNNRAAIINRFLQGLNFYEATPDKARDSIMQWHWKNDPLPFLPPRNNVTDWCATEKWGDWTHPKRQLADQYIKNFAFVLNEENIRVKDFDEIVEICRKKNLRLIFVILPENLEEAGQLVDEDLVNLMISNKNWLTNRYKNKDVSLVDCFASVADSCFIERVFPSEHYNEIGRMTIAKAVANAINL